ncbi:MAG: peptidase [Rhodospirillaceae bacterium]|nr:peptidase [Rhodospirillaceae bacterium]MBT5667010.1 peptidase [Rhodospirillaceae bacterium]MBT5811714.1 peptidase [Rhodospirillaceae bacterium]
MYSDFGQMKIPNWASITPSLAFLPTALLADQSFLDIGLHYTAGFAVFTAAAALFAMGAMGGGDVKLLGAAAVWTGWDLLLPYLFLVAIFGGALSISALLLRRRYFAFLIRWLPWANPATAPNVPYGVAIGLAAITLFPILPSVSSVWATLPSPS